MTIPDLFHHFDPLTGDLPGAVVVERRLSDLRGCFADFDAFEAVLAKENPLLYSVASVAYADGDGDLHCGLGRLMPGRIGDEYYLTKGHLHHWREAAEIYIGLSGEGAMLLEDEKSGESRLLELRPNCIAYVPGGAMHRTINTGNVPLVYLGIYSPKAGHDYAAIAARNFRYVVVQRDGRPTLEERKALHVPLRI